MLKPLLTQGLAGFCGDFGFRRLKYTAKVLLRFTIVQKKPGMTLSSRHPGL